MKPDRWNCRHDYEQELIEQAKQERHLVGECDPDCEYCELARELSETALGG